MSIDPKYSERLKQLESDGARLADIIARLDRSYNYLPDEYHVGAREWLSAVWHLIESTTEGGNVYRKQFEEIMSHEYMQTNINIGIAKRAYGVFRAYQRDLKDGLLSAVEFRVVGLVFDDFLEHAEQYHKGNKIREASVLTSAVLEDAIRKVAERCGVGYQGSLGPTIDGLHKQGYVSPVKAKRLKAYVGIRNAALHASWDDFDIRDVGEMISGLKEFILEHLS